MLEATPKNMGGSSIGVLFGAQAVGGALGLLVGGMVADRFGLLRRLLPRGDDRGRQPLRHRRAHIQKLNAA